MQQLEGSKIRSRTKGLEEGETPCRYFLCLENERHAKVFVSSLFNMGLKSPPFQKL